MIYLAVCDANPELFKVGFSFNPPLRVKQYCSSTRVKFSLINSYNYLGGEKFGPEGFIHHRLSEFRAEDVREALGKEVYYGEFEYFDMVIKEEILEYNRRSSAISQREIEDEEKEDNPRYLALSNQDAVHKFLSLLELEDFAKHRHPDDWCFFKLTKYAMDVKCTAVEVVEE